MDEEDVEPERLPMSLVTEPPQHPDVRRKIRIQYRTLLNDVSSKRSELLSGNTVVLKEKIDDTNQIFANVKHPREAALDAQCCASIANLGKQKAQALSTGYGNFSIAEFAEKLITRVGRSIDDEDESVSRGPAIGRAGWIRLGTAVQTFFKRSPTLHYMYGMLDREEKVRTKTSRADKLEEEKNEQLKAAVKPKELDKSSQSEEVTTREVENVLGILKKTYIGNGKCPMCYFEFVTNPTSFAQTIENVFYTSFLIRDGYARMFLDEDGLPVIEPVLGAGADIEPENDDDDDNNCHQMVMSWTLDDWKDVVDSFNITESIIPTRAASKQPSTANTTPEINGGASTSERARASSAGRTTPKSPRSAHAGPSGASTSSKSSVSRSASATSLSTTRRASRRHWAIEDSDDDDA